MRCWLWGGMEKLFFNNRVRTMDTVQSKKKKVTRLKVKSLCVARVWLYYYYFYQSSCYFEFFSNQKTKKIDRYFLYNITYM